MLYVKRKKRHRYRLPQLLALQTDSISGSNQVSTCLVLKTSAPWRTILGSVWTTWPDAQTRGKEPTDGSIPLTARRPLSARPPAGLSNEEGDSRSWTRWFHRSAPRRNLWFGGMSNSSPPRQFSTGGTQGEAPWAHFHPPAGGRLRGQPPLAAALRPSVGTFPAREKYPARGCGNPQKTD